MLLERKDEIEAEIRQRVRTKWKTLKIRSLIRDELQIVGGSSKTGDGARNDEGA